jgi:NhaP-type Na+/H+ or K+/H+ antiporter
MTVQFILSVVGCFSIGYVIGYGIPYLIKKLK